MCAQTEILLYILEDKRTRQPGSQWSKTLLHELIAKPSPLLYVCIRFWPTNIIVLIVCLEKLSIESIKISFFFCWRRHAKFYHFFFFFLSLLLFLRTRYILTKWRIWFFVVVSDKNIFYYKNYRKYYCYNNNRTMPFINISDTILKLNLIIIRTYIVFYVYHYSEITQK